MPHLVLINGLPGTGKTTLAGQLSSELNMPCLSKDALKEFFFDTLGSEGRESSRMLGRATSRMLYILAEEYIAAGRDIILESAFFAEFARNDFQDILNKYPVNVIEIYCTTDKDVRRERFSARSKSGTRHPGHDEGTDLAGIDTDDPEPLETYAPLEVGKLVKIDTTSSDSHLNEALIKNVRLLVQSADL